MSDIPVTEGEDAAFDALGGTELPEGEDGALGSAGDDDQDDAPEQPEEEAPLAPRFEEWHVTVEGDPLAWATFCRQEGAEPLYIELSDRRLQLLSTLRVDPAEFVSLAEDQGFKVVRIKHEVSALRPGEKALYYEAHAKFNGPFRPDRRSSSRDLYRVNRWYLTRREAEPFSLEQFEAATRLMSKPSTFVGAEYEACILDTNPAIDDGWLSNGKG